MSYFARSDASSPRSLSPATGLQTLEARELLAAQPVISEFLASNGGSLLDGFGGSSDWIELFNAGDVAVDLNGYHLTDDLGEPDQWAFSQPTVLEPGAFLVVFASDLDTIDPDGFNHTNFKLSAGGEEIALVAPDGTTIVDQYSPDYPAQTQDVSYGVAMQPGASGGTLIEAGDVASGLIPINNNDPSVAWTFAGFDDSAWPISGPTGIGYENSPGDPVNYSADIATTIPSGTTSLYLRIPFTLTSTAGLSSLTLQMKFDDGFVAYVNGVRVASANAPDTISSSSAASANHDDTEAVVFEAFDASAGLSQLQLGENILAIHALNLPVSSDMLHTPRLIATSAELVTPTNVGFFPTPTPGSANLATPIQGFATAPTFSTAHGFYDAPQTVALSTATPNGLILYTTDGSEPVFTTGQINGTPYSTPLTISSSTTLRAVTFAEGFEPSDVAVASYLFVDDIIDQSNNGAVPGPDWAPNGRNGQELTYGIDPDIINLYGAEAIKNSLLEISSISITTDLDNLFDSQTGIYVNAENRGRDWERPASVELIDPTGTYVDGGFSANAGLRIRGGFGRGDFNPKHAFRLYFRGEYGDSKLEYPLFGADAAQTFDVLDLRTASNYSWSSNGSFENTFVREVFGRDLQREMGQPHTRSDYHHLYLNGQYWGLFQTQERVQKDFGESYFGGDDSDYDVVKSDLGVSGGTEIADGNDDAWRDLFDLAQGLANNPTGNANHYWTMQGRNANGTLNPNLDILLDVDNLADYMLTIFYTGGFDTGLSTFLGNNKANNWFGLRNRVTNDNGFQFFIHDNEHSLGSANSINIDRTGPFNEGNQNSFAQFNPQYLHQDLMASPEYRLAFADRVRQHFFDDGVMTADASKALLNTRIAQVDPVIIAESARWGDSKVSSPFDKSDWENEIDTLLGSYFGNRNTLVLNQLKADQLYPSIDAPAFSQSGGQVPAGLPLTMTSATGTIYFTTDGSDPRAVGGAIGGTAQPFNQAVVINDATTVRARVLSGSTWSAETQAIFAVGETGLRITEINYNPAAPSASELAAGYTDNDEFEFIEFMNVNSEDPVSLQNVSLTGGLDFTFGEVSLQPGERAVVVENADAFVSRYGNAINILGTWSGGLSNGGEAINVLNAVGTPLVTIDYGDSDPWPQAADGQGATLSLIDPAATPVAELGKPYRWDASFLVNGTPGAASFDVPVNQIVINEVLTHTDLPLSDTIELFNPTATDISLNGWYLSDDGDDLLKFAIPAGTTIPAGGYLTFDESDFNPTPEAPLPSHFALNAAEGDEVWLSIGGSGSVQAIVDQISFGAAFNGVSFGRTPNGTGRFAPMQNRTLGSTNADPEIGPLVISEIQYHPDEPSTAALAIEPALTADDLEFIEIFNPTAATVELTDWRLRGDADHDFTAGSTLESGSAVVLVSFDPTLPINVNRTAAFRAHYGIAANVDLVGPFNDGVGPALSDSHGRVTLQAPDDPPMDNPLLVPHVLVDEAVYDDLAPWPVAADGSGSSLNRTAATDYGNDAASWSGVTASPGSASLSVVLPGDANLDGRVDLLDLDILGQNWQASGATVAEGDFNGDGVVNLLDLDILGQNWGSGTASAAGFSPLTANPSITKARTTAATQPTVRRLSTSAFTFNDLDEASSRSAIANGSSESGRAAVLSSRR